MHLSITSIFTTCLLTSLLILIFCFISHQDKILEGIGVECMIGVLVAVMLRMFIPFQFPYTKNIWIEDVFMSLFRALRYPVLSQPFRITIWDALVILWMISVIYKLVHKIYLYRKIIRYVSLLPKQQWDVVIKEYDLEQGKFQRVEHIGLVCNSQFSSPCLVGLKHPYIVLPTLEYGKENLQYILLHELMHVRNKDILWKILIDLLCLVFWWNPLFYYLKKELFQLIELRNDLELTAKLSNEEKSSYMECLKDIALQLPENDVIFGVSFSGNNFKELVRRMKMISADNCLNRWMKRIFLTLSVIVMFLSSTIIFEPYSVSRAEIGDNAVCLTSNDMYLIKNGDQYDVYVFGEYAMTVDREYVKFFQEVKIYKSLEDVLDE